MPRIVALTGGTGFIGKALWRHLEDAGWIVRALIRPSFPGQIPASVNSQCITGYLENEDSLRSLVHGVDAVVHCAGVVRGVDPNFFYRVNVEGVSRLAKAAAEQKPLPRFLLISSLAAREPALSDYAFSKWQGERVLAAAAGKMSWIALRPPAVYGPNDRDLTPLFRWIRRGLTPQLGPDEARFSLLYVDDLAEAVAQWLNGGDHEGQAFELHDGHPGGYTWKEVSDIVADKMVIRIKVPTALLFFVARVNQAASKILGYDPTLTVGKVRELRHLNWVCDNSALNHALGWSPLVSLEEGMRRIFHPREHKTSYSL